MITYELIFNGFRETDRKRGLFIDYEFINYGFINNNYSELKKRIYKIENNDFIRESTFYKNGGLFSKSLSNYLTLKKRG